MWRSVFFCRSNRGFVDVSPSQYNIKIGHAVPGSRKIFSQFRTNNIGDGDLLKARRVDAVAQ